ncbi:Rtr1/RPAP2 family-domain-containing protein [Xylariaceae sp. FL1019]|nr:Rtr1/RPAP2 family-domain-containing protein [Xylariaceae sp. FL1019]
MATASKTPKGILKKPSSTPTIAVTDHDKPKPSPRDLATQHAQIIHSRHAIEDQISDSLILLSKYPLSRAPSNSAANASPPDAKTFKNLVRLYQPSDYDDLIEERNANNLCGYTLCPLPKSRVTGGGTFKLVNYGRRDFNIVPTKELEKWCSQKCAKRAMYIKVQLSETAAWERAGIESIRIDLFEEEERHVDELARGMESIGLEAQQKSAQNARDLALERGDKMDNGKVAKPAVKVNLKEKMTTTPAQEPVLDTNKQAHLLTEGYKTMFEVKEAKASLDAEHPADEGNLPNK